MRVNLSLFFVYTHTRILFVNLLLFILWTEILLDTNEFYHCDILIMY